MDNKKAFAPASNSALLNLIITVVWSRVKEVGMLNAGKTALKEFLETAFIIDRRIRSKEKQMQRNRDEQMRLGGGLRQDVVQSSRNLDKQAQISDTIMDIENDCRDEMTKLLRHRERVKKIVNLISDGLYCLILEERYVNMKDWKDIATDNSYSERQLHNLHTKALRELNDCIMRCFLETL